MENKYGYTLTNGKYEHRIIYFKNNPTHPRQWHVHHINGQKKDNRIENLILLKPIHHALLHQTWPMRKLPDRTEIEAWLNGLRGGFPKQKKVKKAVLQRIKRLARRGRNLKLFYPEAVLLNSKVKTALHRIKLEKEVG